MNSYDGYENIKGWRAEDFGESPAALARVHKYIIHSATGGMRSGRAIDVGFGNGGMLTLLNSLDFDALGIELNSILCDRARTAGFQAFESFDAYSISSGLQEVDLVTCFHVLEHIEKKNLNVFFSEIAKVLTPSGYFIAAFPNGESPFSALAQNGDLTHETQLTRETCRLLGNANGLLFRSYSAFPPPALFSTKLSERFFGYLRFSCEKIVGAALRFSFYGRTAVEMSPVAYCVWRKN